MSTTLLENKLKWITCGTKIYATTFTNAVSVILFSHKKIDNNIKHA